MTISQFCWNKNVENAMTKQLLYMYITSCCLFVCLFVVVVVVFVVFFLGGGMLAASTLRSWVVVLDSK